MTVDYDANQVQGISIDGVAAYAFSVNDSSILTAIDGERIQFDAARQIWSSDFRGAVSSQGQCKR